MKTNANNIMKKSSLEQDPFTRFSQRSYRLAALFVNGLAVLFLTILFFVNFIWTCLSTDMTTQKVLTDVDSIFRNLFLLLIAMGFLCLFQTIISINAGLCRKILLFVVPCHVFLWGMILLLFSKTVPAADAMSVYSCAEQIASGDYSSIQPTGSYLSYYPQQIGLIAFWEPLLRMIKLLPFSVRTYHFMKICYVVMTCAICHYLYKITDAIWKDEKVNTICLLLCGMNAPLIMYSSFLYSEIPSFLALLFGFYHLLRLLSKDSQNTVLTCVATLLGMTLAVLYRKNTLIFMIAAVIVLLFEYLVQKRKVLLITAILTVILSLSILPCLTKFYELRAGNSLKSGVPAMSYFAMGMQESSRANGWYNGFNFNTYDKTGMDHDETVRLSKAAISERLSYFQSNPSYCIHFYAEKFLSQWADGTYACRQATLATFGGRSAFFQEIYEGKYSSLFVSYCNAYQLFLYLGAIAFALSQHKTAKNSASLFPYLLFIGAFGGFLFHMIWEANSRYILPYWLCLLPYGFCGISRLSLSITSFPIFQRIRNTEEPPAREKDSEAVRKDQGKE